MSYIRPCITHTTATSGRIYPYRAAKQQAARGCSRCCMPYLPVQGCGAASGRRLQSLSYDVCLERLAEDTDSDTCLGLLVPTP